MIIKILDADNKNRKRAMVIDKDMDMTRLLDGILGMEGYDIIIAVDEEEASDIMKKVSPDIIIVDTDTASEENLHTISSLRTQSDVPIIILSSDAETETLKTVFDHGADDYILKPFAASTFKARIHAKLRRCSQKSHAKTTT